MTALKLIHEFRKRIYSFLFTRVLFFFCISNGKFNFHSLGVRGHCIHFTECEICCFHTRWRRHLMWRPQRLNSASVQVYILLKSLIRRDTLESHCLFVMPVNESDPLVVVDIQDQLV